MWINGNGMTSHGSVVMTWQTWMLREVLKSNLEVLFLFFFFFFSFNWILIIILPVERNPDLFARRNIEKQLRSRRHRITRINFQIMEIFLFFFCVKFENSFVPPGKSHKSSKSWVTRQYLLEYIFDFSTLRKLLISGMYKARR